MNHTNYSTYISLLLTGNITNAVKYIEDLRAFQAIVKAFKFRGVVASDVNVALAGVEQARYFNYNVDDIADIISVSYAPSTDDFSLQQFVVQRESHMRGSSRSNLPVWLDVKLPRMVSSDSSCDHFCLQRGLRYATLLGDAAHNGFAVVFKSLEREEIHSHSFTYLVALLHRTLVGSKVFDVPRSSPQDIRMYAYCGQGGNGSMTILAINHRAENIEIDVQLAVKPLSTDVQHFIVTVSEGQIHLNHKLYDFSSTLEPFTKIHTLLKGLRLTMPAFSISFWTLPNLNVKECLDDYNNLRAVISNSNLEQHNSVHQLLQELIAERSQQDITQVSRRKRSTTEELEEATEDKPNRSMKRAAKNPARKPRQTKNFRLEQQAVRRKEKRSERRNMKRQRRPLRERGKRQLRKKNLQANRKKTKRSFMAEAVDKTPVFGASQEEEVNRSSFPQGDVHLLISKGKDGEDFLSVEEASFKDEPLGKIRKMKLAPVSAPSKTDMRFMMPELAMFNQPSAPSQVIDRYLPLKTEEDLVGDLEVQRQLIEPRTPQNDTKPDSSSSETNAIDEDSKPTKKPRRKTTTIAPAVVEEIQDSVQEDDEFDLFTQQPEHYDENSEEQEAYVEEVKRRRRKRSVSSSEINRIEAFFMNNTQLQQKFAEMFDMLLESFQCCGESAEENTAREETEETHPEQQLERTKRNALLHPQSWEQRERSNVLHQQRTSAESAENTISTESNVAKIREKVKRVAGSGKQELGGVKKLDVEESGRPGVLMLRQVTNFMKEMSTGMHRIFSHWFPKTSKE